MRPFLPGLWLLVAAFAGGCDPTSTPCPCPCADASDHPVPTDTGMADTGMADTGMADTGAVDAAADTGPACPTGQLVCNGECTAVQVDFYHCGSCTRVCSPGQVCDHGDCNMRCPPSARGTPLPMCLRDGGVQICVDMTIDPDFCGNCFTACPHGPHSTAFCAASRCGLACEPGWGDCNVMAADGCETDLSTDRANCAACGLACPTGQTCSAGRCTP